ncbi:hypothetical protein H5410_032374 [Solanum commersonii]|uniref:C3H1-type domain-containing protein n=1 Tax=Solanum commersonii TaxID=4109 RepID=A0A9J5YPH2_SOLCO|nr:hypothetical protein H5410_032374 [Solanum commersonii]
MNGDSNTRRQKEHNEHERKADLSQRVTINVMYHKAWRFPSLSWMVVFAGSTKFAHPRPLWNRRPGLPECHYYMTYGDCKFGSLCKHHHPPEWSGTKAALILSAMGLPPDM